MAQPGTPAILSERRWVTLSVAALAQLTLVLDATVVNIARPSAQRALGFPDSDRQRVVTAYALAFGSLLLLRTAVARSGQAGSNADEVRGPERARHRFARVRGMPAPDPGTIPVTALTKPTERHAQARLDRQPDDRQRSSAMTNGPAHSQHQAIPVDDPKRPPLDEAARRAFVAASVALVPHYRTGLLLTGAQR